MMHETQKTHVSCQPSLDHIIARALVAFLDQRT